jgi:xanthine dehydrogenase YagT iron-sulfur-binding subunit
MMCPEFTPSRRDVLGGASATAFTVGLSHLPVLPAHAQALRQPAPKFGVSMDVNGVQCAVALDPRTTLLDMLREQLRLTGTKKGCDHGHCGACTVLVNGTRINACLSLVAMHDGDSITTIEGLGSPDALDPMQRAFLKHDGFQCGYCTPGQICSAVAVLEEVAKGVPSHVTENIAAPMQLTNLELRERMSGNICRCGAYSNIADAISEIAAAG